MKKTLIALLALAGIAAAGTEETITLQAAPQTACSWQPEFGIDYLHGIGSGDHEIDMQGFRASIGMTYNANSTFSHQFSLNAGYEFGEDEAHIGDIFSYKQEVSKTTVTLGYDLNCAVSDKWKLFVGAKAGYASNHYETEVQNVFSASGTMDGYTYSVGGGVKYQISETANLKAGYEFHRSFYGNNGNVGNIIINQHIISVGLGFKF